MRKQRNVSGSDYAGQTQVGGSTGSVQSGILATAAAQAAAQTPDGGNPIGSSSNVSSGLNTFYYIVGILAAVAVIASTFVRFQKVQV
jgi:hypothetical protein